MKNQKGGISDLLCSITEPHIGSCVWNCSSHQDTPHMGKTFLLLDEQLEVWADEIV